MGSALQCECGRGPWPASRGLAASLAAALTAPALHFPALRTIHTSHPKSEVESPGVAGDCDRGSLGQPVMTCSPENCPPHSAGSLSSWCGTQAEHKTRLGLGLPEPCVAQGEAWPTVTVMHSDSCHHSSWVIVP